MKKGMLHCFLVFIAALVSIAAMAQSESNPVQAFKDIHKEADPHFEQDIKKKELQKAPSLLYIDKTDRIIKKNKRRKTKLT
jgi:hypothetical protein